MDSETTVVLGPARQCIGCQAVGVPESGYDFYCCIACLDQMIAVLERAEAGALVESPKSEWIS